MPEEHHKISIEESVSEEVHGPQEQNDANVNLLPASIIVGAILISASLFYNTKLIIKNLSPANNLSLVDQYLKQQAPSQANQSAGQGSVPSQPTGPVSVVVRSDAPSLGSNDAKVVMYEFSDFQCPYCQRFFKDTFSAIKAKYVNTGKVRFVYRHFPLPFHVNAEIAAQAGECANRQGKFWEYHDILFAKGQPDGAGLDSASLKKYAKDIRLNTASFNSCLDNKETLEVVKKDQDNGTAAGVNGTPTFYLNGKQIVGAQPITAFEPAIEAALK